MYKLLIHDRDEESFNKVKDKYAGWKILSDQRNIHPCIGCFTCWNRTPGKCIYQDGYGQMAALIDGAEEIIYDSRFTYGGFSAFIKNVFDRTLGYVLPYFEVSDNEMHHKRRYSDVKKITFIFRGNKLNDEEKQMARNYVEAVCHNMRSEVKEVLFEEEGITKQKRVSDIEVSADKTVLLNCSLRGVKANSEKFLQIVSKELGTCEYYRLAEYQNDEDELLKKVLSAGRIVLAMPLYVDGLSSTVIRLLEKAERYANGKGRKIYVLANLGLYESQQLKNLLAMMKYWCAENGYEYSGSICIGAGELIGSLIGSIGFGPVKPALRGLKEFAAHIRRAEEMPDLFVQPLLFPRWLYIAIANSSWDSQAQRAGMRPEDLLARPKWEE